MMSKDYPFKPALIFDFLTPFYDLFGDIGLRKKLQARALRFFKLKDGWKLLDVGSGTGPDLILLSKKFSKMKLFGIDADPKIIALAKKKIKKHNLDINLKCAYAQELPFAANSFDAVWSNLTLHHLTRESKIKAIEEMYRVLKPHGQLLLIEFSRPKSWWLKSLMRLQTLFSYVYDNYQGKIPLFLKDCGFKKLRQTTFWGNTSCYQAEK